MVYRIPAQSYFYQKDIIGEDTELTNQNWSFDHVWPTKTEIQYDSIDF